MSNDVSEFPCPYCKNASLETTASAPYVRGFLVAYQIGSKAFIGCTSCVRKKVWGEAFLSMLIGWFSITALVINPFMIVYNLIRGCFIGENKKSVAKKLEQL